MNHQDRWVQRAAALLVCSPTSRFCLLALCHLQRLIMVPAVPQAEQGAPRRAAVRGRWWVKRMYEVFLSTARRALMAIPTLDWPCDCGPGLSGGEAEFAADSGPERPVATAQDGEHVERDGGRPLEGPDAPLEAVADEVHWLPVKHELAVHEYAALIPATAEHHPLADEPLADHHSSLSPAAAMAARGHTPARRLV